jgi:hypothetical protein
LQRRVLHYRKGGVRHCYVHVSKTWNAGADAMAGFRAELAAKGLML